MIDRRSFLTGAAACALTSVADLLPLREERKFRIYNSYYDEVWPRMSMRNGTNPQVFWPWKIFPPPHAYPVEGRNWYPETKKPPEGGFRDADGVLARR